MRKLTGFLFILVSASVCASIQPADGLWGTYDNPDVGSGLLMMTQGETTVVTIFTYRDDGQPIWYLASGQVDSNGQLEATLYQTTQGQYLTASQPGSASFSDQTQQLVLNFAGNNEATFSIDGAVERIIRPVNFGFADDAGLPDLSGQWLLANHLNGVPMMLDLQKVPSSPITITPFQRVFYESTHPDTAGWLVDCYVLLIVQIDFQCVFNVPAEEQLWYLSDLDVDNKQMLLRTPDLAAVPVMQGFRLDSDQRLLPNDGYWRPQYDPEIGSGMVMHTQGNQTLVMVYSYDDSGEPLWQIAAGQFDANGLLETQLYTAFGGTPLTEPDPTSAEFNSSTLDLTVQLIGTELATFNIGGSTPQFIQNFNHSSILYETEQFLIDDQPFQFPLLNGEWVMVDAERQHTSQFNLIEISGTISPLPPTAPLIYANMDDHPANPFSVSLLCHRRLVNNETIGHCDGVGSFLSQAANDQFRTYFQDIGHHRFRMYYGEDQAGIDRSSPYYDFFRVSAFD